MPTPQQQQQLQPQPMPQQQAKSSSRQYLSKESSRSKTKIKVKTEAEATSADTVALILWMKSEQARITREMEDLNAQGYTTHSLHVHWHFLAKQVQKLEYDLVLEQSAKLSLDK
ncbi:hypothetical protein BGX29_011973 [Mortierella sp. GBA35]|nr:hypothetical protein BGX23_012193 [Mortierella sp. AD031]KAF9089628.1 hypothetical protein BGX29_011973 [Mortierella sp. GBA35]KAG0199747.1 hypothetical protein BGX33_011475 [Mortierella sp. NVP41]